MKSKPKKDKSENEKEKCVLCGEETEYTFSTPVSERKNYIKAVGQLCQKCHYDLCISKSRKKI